MSKEKPATKICKHCKTEIPYDAKVCPQCRKKVKGGMMKWIVIAVAAIIIIGALAGGGDKNTGGTQKIGEVSQASQAADTFGAGKQENTAPEQATQTEPAEETETESESPAEEVKTVYNVGDILKDGDMEIVYMSSGEYVSDNEFIQPAEGNKYIFIQLAFRNTSANQDARVSSLSFECYADGYSADAHYNGGDDLSATLSAGRSTSGYLYFEVPENAEEIEIEYKPNVFLDKKITFTYEGEQDSGYVLEGNNLPTEGALHVGEKAESKSLNIAYLSCYADESDNMFIQPKDGYHYVTCEFEFENVSSSDQTVTAYSFDCYADGIDCDGTYFREDNISATMSAGRKAKGTVTFEVPDDAQVVEVEYLSNYWTSNRVVFMVEE